MDGRGRKVVEGTDKKVDLQCDLEHVYKKVEEVNGSTGHYFFPCCLTGLREGRRS